MGARRRRSSAAAQAQQLAAQGTDQSGLVAGVLHGHRRGGGGGRSGGRGDLPPRQREQPDRRVQPRKQGVAHGERFRVGSYGDAQGKHPAAGGELWLRSARALSRKVDKNGPICYYL